MTDLYLLYDEHRSGGGICEGQEDEAWPSFNDTYIEFYPHTVVDSRNKAGTFPEKFEVKEDVGVGDVVHVVIARYGDGDTFSHTNGHWQLMGASTDPMKAEELATAINRDEYTGAEDAAAESYDRGYAPWSGYFSSLESCDVHTFVVQ